MEAARWGFEQMVELLLTRGADANLRTHDGLTALHMAHPRKHRIFQLLVGHGADLHARDDYEATALLRVSGHSREEAEDTVRVLLDLGADIHSRDTLGDTALFNAAAMGHCRMIQVLMDYGADIHARSKFGRSMLHSTSESKVVRLLLGLRADVHSQDSHGNTALARAAAKGLFGTVKLILDHKPKINTSNGAGDTAPTLAADAEVTLEGSDRYDKRGNRIDDRVRMAAAIKGDLTIIEFLLNHGASVDLKNKAGNTALTRAAAEGNLEAVKLLLNHGANAHAMNEAGYTALSLATEMGRSGIHQLLVEHLSEPKQPPVCTEVE